MSWENSYNIAWNMTKPPSKDAGVFDGNYEKYDLVKTKEAMNKVIPIEKGDEIVILYNQGEPIFTTKYNRSDRRLKTVLQHLYEALQKPIEVNHTNAELVYPKIANFFRSEMRLKLVKKYESGKLKFMDLLGDHIYFEGMGREGKKKLIHYSTGS